MPTYKVFDLTNYIRTPDVYSSNTILIGEVKQKDFEFTDKSVAYSYETSSTGVMFNYIDGEQIFIPWHGIKSIYLPPIKSKKK